MIIIREGAHAFLGKHLRGLSTFGKRARFSIADKR